MMVGQNLQKADKRLTTNGINSVHICEASKFGLRDILRSFVY